MMPMTETERRALLERVKESTRAAKLMSSEEATRRLIDEGFLDRKGRVSPKYAGKISARA
jgi:hypothetical protein